MKKDLVILLCIFLLIGLNDVKGNPDGQQWTGTIELRVSTSESGVAISVWGGGTFSFTVSKLGQISGQGTFHGTVSININIQGCTGQGSIDYSETSSYSGKVDTNTNVATMDITTISSSAPTYMSITCTIPGTGEKTTITIPIPAKMVTLSGQFQMPLTDGYVYNYQFQDPLSGYLRITITKVSVQYNVTFTVSGLPPGVEWWVNLNGENRSSILDFISFSKPDGTYRYSAGVSHVFDASSFPLKLVGVRSTSSGTVYNNTLTVGDIVFIDGTAIRPEELYSYSLDPDAGKVIVDGDDVNIVLMAKAEPVSMFDTITMTYSRPNGSLLMRTAQASYTSILPAEPETFDVLFPIDLINYVGTWKVQASALIELSTLKWRQTLTVQSNSLTFNVFSKPKTLSITVSGISWPIQVYAKPESPGWKSLNISDLQFIKSRQNDYSLSFKVTGESGTRGSITMVIPTTVVPYGLTPIVTINGNPAPFQQFISDSGNYYIFFRLQFSIDYVTIHFVPGASLTNIYFLQGDGTIIDLINGSVGKVYVSQPTSVNITICNAYLGGDSGALLYTMLDSVKSDEFLLQRGSSYSQTYIWSHGISSVEGTYTYQLQLWWDNNGTPVIEDSKNITIIVSPPIARLTVYVIGAQDQSLSGAQVEIKDAQGNTIFSGVSNEQGMVSVNVPYGTYTVTVDYKGFTNTASASVNSPEGKVKTIAIDVFIEIFGQAMTFTTFVLLMIVIVIVVLLPAFAIKRFKRMPPPPPPPPPPP